ncbi:MULTISPECIES: alpha/beta fold hydrolase [unclassified Beijerinckia]|uniref:alpha/beta fold hydrolase n=1 Tax=unclassified Beijerinckia TaxID=2638183 RepID=UPI00089B4137|nr:MULTISPECIES: alpha/beta fold hydrolase [unclassified Beijerinckia]MDH7795200.1 pimeloyl-ACP methyl ester carboxylesterase [Beijerinckia sp. GAS462]SEB91748.1 Pimeloyl-ACP methyl ester carboxylesterase [Beijerinckia sp. 28-YEA-48]
MSKPVRHAAVGREPSSGLYYEIMGEGSSYRYHLLFIHGGGSTGDVFRATPDGRLGWADQLAAQGFRCWLTDWPGTGRSGYRDILTLQYQDVVDGYIHLLRDVIQEPVVIVTHSMGGPTTWKLIEALPDLVAGVMGVATGYPGNLAAKNSKVITDDGRVVHFTFGDTGVTFALDRQKPYVYDDAYVYKQAIGASKLFPMQAIAAFRQSFSAISPLMILQRTGIMPGMPVVEHTTGFANKHIRLIAGSNDPAHTREIEDRTADLLRQWGADANVVWLPDHGITGNGHFLQLELNSDEILDLLIKELRAVPGA